MRADNEIETPKDWRHKLIIRSKSQQLVKKNIIKKSRCANCQETKVIMAHLDYKSPYNVIFLCRKHYNNYRKKQKILSMANNISHVLHGT